MRQKRNPQMSLFMTNANTKIGKELEQMSRILDDTPELLQIVFDDLVKSRRTDTGRQVYAAQSNSPIDAEIAEKGRFRTKTS